MTSSDIVIGTTYKLTGKTDSSKCVIGTCFKIVQAYSRPGITCLCFSLIKDEVFGCRGPSLGLNSDDIDRMFNIEEDKPADVPLSTKEKMLKNVQGLL